MDDLPFIDAPSIGEPSIDEPFIDELRVVVAAPPEVVWRALARQFAPPSGRGPRLLAALLGAQPRGDSGPPLAQGSTIAGFEVVRARPGERVVLAGRHRYSAYTLTFTLTENPASTAGSASTTLTAATHARFPGPLGAAYRLLVISSGAHRLVAGRLLQAVRSRSTREPS